MRIALRPIPASEWVTFKPGYQEALKRCFGFPVNDVFLPLWHETARILLLYGGYGSGKSIYIADYLIKECLENDYFKCLYGRKIFETVRISAFDTICDRIEELGLKHLFDYSRADNSSMIIKCKVNGNRFIPFGADKIEKLKSVKDATHVWCEEMDQFTSADYGVLNSRLRKKGVKKQFIGAFNSTAVTEEHWVYKTFFKEGQGSELRIKKVFCNYTDNYFIDHKEYEETLWESAAYDEVKFREISAGEWGAVDKSNLYIYTFRQKERPDLKPGHSHISKLMIKSDPKLPLILSFDFNVEPITCSVHQHENNLSKPRTIAEYRLMNSDIFELCSRILIDYPGFYYKVTGDASGRSRTAITRGNKNYFQVIQTELKISNRQFVLPGKNPSIANSRVLCNRFLAKHPDYVMNESCLWLREDLKNVTVDEHGEIDKKKDAHKTHLLDTWRYYLWNFHYSFLKAK